MALKAGRVGVNPNYVDKEGRPLYDNSYLKELLRKEGIITLFTKEGNPISIDNAVAGRVYDLAVTMAPKQAGTGTPSPTNVREISGYAGLTITVNGTDIERDFDTTVYGGVDDVTGEGVTATISDLNDIAALNWTYDSANQRFGVTLSEMKSGDTRTMEVWATCYQCITDGRPLDQVPDYSIYTAQNGLYVHDSRYTTVSDFKTALTGQKVIYPLATPTSISLTHQAIALLTGSNTLSSDAGTTMDLKYLGTLVPGGANGRSLNRSLNLNREVIGGEERKEILEEIKEEVPVEEPVTVKKSTKKSTK